MHGKRTIEKKGKKDMPDMNQKPYEVISIAENAWRIEDNGVRALLFVGDEKALLVDTCFGNNGSLKDIVNRLTDKPITVINTHADDDHTGCNKEFATVLMHPADFAVYHSHRPGMPVEPVWEGDVIDLGGWEFEVIHLPGHTPGSIGLLDRRNRVLVGGDSISYTPVFMFTSERSMEAHVESMKKLMKMQDAFDVIYAAHGPMEVEKEQIQRFINAGGKILNGEVEGKEPAFPVPAKVFTYEGASYFFNLKE